MICTKCGTLLEDNAKFCTKCGTPISIEDAHLQNETSYTEAATEQSLFTKQSIQETQHGAVKTPYTQYADSAIQRPQNNIAPYLIMPQTSKTSAKSIAVIALIIFLFVSVGLIISNLYTSNLRLENEKKYYQDQVEDYENENAVDKTVDAISSWFDYFGY